MFLKILPLGLLFWLDQLSKIAISWLLTPGETMDLLPFLSLHYSRNSGIAFSLLEQNNPAFLSLATGLIIIFMFYMLYKHHDRLSIWGYELIIAGALGNLCDRLRLGYVVDFIYFHIPNLFNFAIFNLADSFITLGACCIIAREIFKNPKARS